MRLLTGALLTLFFSTCATAADPVAKPSTPSLDELLLFVPVKIPPEEQLDPPAGGEAVWVTSKDGTRLYAWWCPREKPQAYVLYLHGNAGNLWTCARYIRWMHETAGCAVLAIDYRGYGYSEGHPSVEGVLQDVRAARDELTRRSGQPGREVIIGRSLGGALAIDLAAERAPRGLVLESTFLTFKDVARHHAGALAEIVPEERLNSRASLQKYHGPLLQVHGDADRIVPYAQGVALHQAASGEKKFLRIPNGGHNNSLTPEYLQALQQFLKSLP